MRTSLRKLTYTHFTLECQSTNANFQAGMIASFSKTVDKYYLHVVCAVYFPLLQHLLQPIKYIILMRKNQRMDVHKYIIYLHGLKSEKPLVAGITPTVRTLANM